MTGEITLPAACCPSAVSRRSCWQRSGPGSRRFVIPRKTSRI